MKARPPSRAEAFERAVKEILAYGRSPESYVRGQLNMYFNCVAEMRSYPQPVEVKQVCGRLKDLLRVFSDDHPIPIAGFDRKWMTLREFRSALDSLARRTGARPDNARGLAALFAATLYPKDPKHPRKRWPKYREVAQWFYFAYSAQWANLKHECDAERVSWQSPWLN
jgi:hypothetical protein